MGDFNIAFEDNNVRVVLHIAATLKPVASVKTIFNFESNICQHQVGLEDNYVAPFVSVIKK